MKPNQPLEPTPPRCALRRASTARWIARDTMRILVLLAIAFLSGSVNGEQLLRTAGLSLPLPSKLVLRSQPGATPLEFDTADGHIIGVTVMRGAPGISDLKRGELLALHRQFAQTELPRLASNKGDLSHPLSSESLSNGDSLFMTGTRVKRLLGKPKFYFQFFDIHDSGSVALITIEGPEQGEPDIERYATFVRRLTWDD